MGVWREKRGNSPTNKAMAMAASLDDHEVEAGWLGGEADGEEEPLFADDITDDDEDPPPLPPPMPSLGELSAQRQRVSCVT